MKKKVLENQILLSICVMTSGRQETTEKCIASLERLRENVPSELIVTDTGCQPKLRAWLEDHADKVIDFKWCNDFSAARNTGLGEAKGKWFLYLDDDEWFENTAEIEEFFNSGEYRQFKSALYKVRNYADSEGSLWRDSYLSRMVRRQEDTRFVYPIHEALAPVLPPMKYLEDYVHHYGYVFKNKEEEKAKRERNLSLLLQAIEKDRHCMRYYIQGMTEYAAVNDFQGSLEMAYEGIKQYDPSRWDNDRYIHALYAAVVRRLINLGRYQEACREAERLINLEKISPLAIATICGDVTLACLKTEAYSKGVRYVDAYLELKTAFEEDRKAYLAQQTMLLETCFESDHYRWVMGAAMSLAAAGLAAGCLEAEVLAKTLFEKEEVQWWKETLQKWYLQSVQAERIKLAADFEKLAEGSRKERQNTCNYGEKAVLLYEKLKQLEAVSQMQQLAVQLKEKIRQLIIAGEREGALEAIGQLKAYFPMDSELLSMEREIGQEK